MLIALLRRLLAALVGFLLLSEGFQLLVVGFLPISDDCIIIRRLSVSSIFMTIACGVSVSAAFKADLTGLLRLRTSSNGMTCFFLSD